MPVIAAYLYRHGRRVREIAIEEQVSCPSDRSEFVWIGLSDPCSDEIETLQRLYGLHPLAVEDSLKDGQLPKVDVYGDQLFEKGPHRLSVRRSHRLRPDRRLPRAQPHHHRAPGLYPVA